MDSRLTALLALHRTNSPSTDTDADADTSDAHASAEDVVELSPGWRKLSERDGWRAAPIGVYVACP